MFWKITPHITNTVPYERKAKKLTQAELALACGVTRQTIIAVEKGNYVPSVALALKLSEVLKTNVEKLFMLTQTKELSQ